MCLCLCHGDGHVLPDLVSRSESTMHRYEVHPYGTLPVGPGPEFKTTLRVRSWRTLDEQGNGEASRGKSLS